ncbi:cytochrome o ubiquinol oxidase subunit IV [uncultured Sphingomonas sp.]|uniref:cytochrome o ubiquinol oxidase subunit IV n=1 Tax=uncultured Sphingomonas sp. TaxID=158754 RepID=UPI0035CBE7B5
MSDDMARVGKAPGDKDGTSVGKAIGGYAIGLSLAALLTAAAFVLPMTGLVWGPAVPVALVALAIGQMGMHLVFFLHITTGPDNTNNVLALAFGLLIVGLVLIGSIWIMAHLNHAMMPMSDLSRMQR